VNHLAEDLAPLFPDQNPFSTWAVRPGAIVFRLDDSQTVDTLIARLAEHDWWGEIVGPHGSGKSSLLATLSDPIEQAGRQLCRYRVRRGERQMPIATSDLQAWSDKTQVVIEGYEQLGARNRKLIEATARRRKAGLLVTCHTPLALPTLYETNVTLELAQGIVRDLIPANCTFIHDDDVQAAFERNGQNMRELLFNMYDLYEKRRPRDSNS